MLHAVDRANTIITHDSGSPRHQLVPFWESVAPRTYMGWGKSTQLGYGLGIIMGAKLAEPDKLCINVMGDAAIGMVGMDIETAARHRIGILTVVFNNGAMASERGSMPEAAEKHLYLGGNYRDLARSLGAWSERVEAPDGFLPAFNEAVEATNTGQPALLDVIVKEGNDFSQYPELSRKGPGTTRRRTAVTVKLALETIHSDEEFVAELRREFPDVEFRPSADKEEERANIRDADVFWGSPSRELVLAAERLRWVQCVGTGVEGIVSVREIVDSDVVLTNCRGPHADPLADHVMGMVIVLAHKLNEMWDDQRERRWEPAKYDNRQMDLNGSTMGILALGDIGTAVARRAHGFGMRVYAVDRHPRPAPPTVEEVWGPERLDELLSISDWFVVAAPLTSETRGAIDRRRLGLLKPGAHVIVISRGNIVDEEALIDGLRSGRIAGAGLDAVSVEPLPESSPLWDMKNVVLSPHASGMTPTQWSERMEVFKENLRRFLANEPFLYVVDKKAGF